MEHIAMGSWFEDARTKPYRHQVECLNRFALADAFALLADMGVGKTHIIINNAAYLHSINICDAVLVLAPNGVHTNWSRIEIPKHMPESISYEAHAWRAKDKDDNKQLGLIMKPSSKLRIFTMNWEALQNVRGKTWAMRFCKSAKNLMIVADESDSIKNPKAARTKFLITQLRVHARWRRIMTGTPVNNSPFDLYTQFFFLNPAFLKQKSYRAFCAEYGVMLAPDSYEMRAVMRSSGAKHMPQIVAKDKVTGKPLYRNLNKLSELIAPHSYRVTKAECLDLPEKIYNTVFFDLTDTQRRVYKQAREELLIELEQCDTVLSKLTVLGKLSQICSGYVLNEGTPVRIEGANPKLMALKDLVEQLIREEQKVIIWARYRAEIQDVVNLLTKNGISHVEYHGGVNDKDRQLAIDSFENGDTEVFVGNQQAGGTGITLVAASNVIYYSNNYSLRDRLQSEDRAHRIGQTKTVVYTDIVGTGTIDETVVRKLRDKRDVADEIVSVLEAI